MATVKTDKIKSRRKARIYAFQCLYSLHFAEKTTAEQLHEVFDSLPMPDSCGEGEERQPDPFAWEIVEGVRTHLHDIDEVIALFSKRWRVERLGHLELTVLRLAFFELLQGKVPPKVAINEAMEVSARFVDAKAGSFINGILDSGLKALEAGDLESFRSRISGRSL
ncbi:MAG: transcription antitermination factor NusB [Desulfovibrionaceae bacterium]|nr:transcription antitermination factor NusB [Desulfovibrionaceae bacterium]